MSQAIAVFYTLSQQDLSCIHVSLQASITEIDQRIERIKAAKFSPLSELQYMKTLVHRRKKTEGFMQLICQRIEELETIGNFEFPG